MKFKLKVIFFCIFHIFLFVGCSKPTEQTVNANKGSEATQSASASKTSDKEKNDNDNNKKVAENNQGDKKTKC